MMIVCRSNPTHSCAPVALQPDRRNTMQTKEDTLHSIGADAYAAIAKMVSALHCDYDRMQELRDERDGYDSGGTGESWEQANPDDTAELTELENAAGECQ